MDIKRNHLLRRGLDSPGSGQEQVTGFCEHGNELPGFIKTGKFLQ
jgi:hypothetical protein